VHLAPTLLAASSPLTKIIPGLMIWTIIVFGITLFVLWNATISSSGK